MASMLLVPDNLIFARESYDYINSRWKC